MAGELIIFPVRLGVRVASATVRAGLEVTGKALALAAQTVKAVTPDGSAEAPEQYPAQAPAEPAWPPAAPRAAATQPRAREPEAPPPPAEEPEAPPPPADLVHVSEEPTVVGEFAEPGAEEGAGAEVSISEPWEGYARMSAYEVITRLDDSLPAELVAVQLYEGAHKQRATVTSAAERELRIKSGRGAAAAEQSRKEQRNGD